MTKHSYTAAYNLKWQVSFASQYKVSKCGKVFNTRTNRQIKRVVNGGYSTGYWINSKFYTLDTLRANL